MNSEEVDCLEILFTEEEIKLLVNKVASEINRDYEGKDITLICILKGSIYFTADLSRKLNGNVTLEFMKIKSYTGEKTNMDPIPEYDPKSNIEGKDVIIVEDILDKGYTLNYLLKKLKTRNPRSLKICTLLQKKNVQEIQVKADYVGAMVDDLFVLGYGLDKDEKYRNLPYIAHKVKGKTL